MARPTSGTAWNSIVSAANASVTPDLCNQDNKVDVNALAAGIVYARTGDKSYRSKVIDLLIRAMASQRDGCNNAVLALGRQLTGYVLAADFAGYREGAWLSWLSGIRTRDIGGHGRWHQLRFTSQDSASNWGVHALSSITAADRFLGDSVAVAKDWEVFSGYDGTWPFNKSSSWSATWSCVPDTGTSRLPIAINPVGCVKSGVNLDGAPVEDSSRAAFPSFSTYIHESEQGYVLQAQMLSRAGYPGWFVNEAQVCRSTAFANRAGRLNDSSVSYYVAWMANHFCGFHLPTVSPTAGGREFAFADWFWP